MGTTQQGRGAATSRPPWTPLQLNWLRMTARYDLTYVVSRWCDTDAPAGRRCTLACEPRSKAWLRVTDPLHVLVSTSRGTNLLCQCPPSSWVRAGNLSCSDFAESHAGLESQAV